MQPYELPVYQHKSLILNALQNQQAIIVESPTGSGKTSQMPLILLEAGYAKNGLIGVTQPRRIAAVSVSEYIARQLGTTIPGIIGYKMRFADQTDQTTAIKIMTDGILLQEMKLDPYLTRYGVIIVDEAHERSLNIDFILGLLKRVLEARPEFKVVISSATINPQVFSEYFNECPIVKIEAEAYPVTVIYDPPENGRLSTVDAAQAALLAKIEDIIARIIEEKRKGDILIFLPGEKLIKDCVLRLHEGNYGSDLHCVPLYGRLGKEEQERVFEPAPKDKRKVVVATNIAETSVTINGITSVIDSGLSKLNHYNPRTFTSSLIEGPISKASCNQRKGRAGRTQPGSCYRLFPRRDFENRPLFTTEEIYRTDLSEVVLRMAELGITAFEDFDFISVPSRNGLIAAIETLDLLDALTQERTLSRIGELMARFPLAPRQSRIIVEAIQYYPEVIEESLVAVAFLSTQSPYLLPAGEEIEARQAHHVFRDPKGDFISYLKLYRSYKNAKDKKKFCQKSYLDEKAMIEITNVKDQLELIVSSLDIPILSGGPLDHYLCCIARGLIQFVCVREGRDSYRSLTADRIFIHPGSVMFRENPQYIVAGEIVKTSRMYAMSVSPLQKSFLAKISPTLYRDLVGTGSGAGAKPIRDFTNRIKISGEVFEFKLIKGHKALVLPWERFSRLSSKLSKDSLMVYKDLHAVVTLRQGRFTILAGEKIDLIFRIGPSLDLEAAPERRWPKKRNFNSSANRTELIASLPLVLATALWRPNKNELGFLCLFTDGAGQYWYKCSRGFHTALNESVSSLEALMDELSDEVPLEQRALVNQTYRRLTSYLG